MEINISDKFFWFVFVELVCGFFASVVYVGGFGRHTKDRVITFQSSDTSHETNLLLTDLLLPGAFVPLVFRSQLFTYGKSLSKTLIMVLMIITIVFYIVGGVFLIVDDTSNHTGSALRAVCAIAAGGIMIADLVFQACC